MDRRPLFRLLLPVALLLLVAAALVSFIPFMVHAHADQPAATYTNGKLSLTIPYHSDRAGTGRLIAEIVWQRLRYRFEYADNQARRSKASSPSPRSFAMSASKSSGRPSTSPAVAFASSSPTRTTTTSPKPAASASSCSRPMVP